MGLFEHFPYTNFHGLNLDWILQKLEDLETWKTMVNDSWITPAVVTKEYATTDQDGGGIVTPSDNIYISNVNIRKTGRFVEIVIGFYPQDQAATPLSDVYVYLPRWIYGYPYEYALFTYENGSPVYHSHRTWQHTDSGQLYLHVRNVQYHGYYIHAYMMLSENFQEIEEAVPNENRDVLPNAEVITRNEIVAEAMNESSLAPNGEDVLNSR